MDEFTVVDLSAWRRGDTEPGGHEAKRWYTAPGTEAARWLFKPVIPKELPLSRSRRARGDSPETLRVGDDWAERVAFECARMLRVPSAVYELAVISAPGGETLVGSISRDFRPDGWSGSAGAALIDEIDPEFDPVTCVGHHLENIEHALRDVLGPVGTEYCEWAAFDVFVGFLVLDAWIANTDRHAENWAVLQSPGGVLHLAPSFDHGSALGSGMRQPDFERLVGGEGVPTWASKGRAGRFEGYRTKSLVDLATEALARAGEAARRHWIECIATASIETCNDVLGATPRMSDAARTFVREVLAVNKERLCDVQSGSA